MLTEMRGEKLSLSREGSGLVTAPEIPLGLIGTCPILVLVNAPAEFQICLKLQICQICLNLFVSAAHRCLDHPQGSYKFR